MVTRCDSLARMSSTPPAPYRQLQTLDSEWSVQHPHHRVDARLLHPVSQPGEEQGLYLPLKESVGHLDVLSLDYCEHQVLESRCGVISVEVEGAEVICTGAPPVPMSEVLLLSP